MCKKITTAVERVKFNGNKCIRNCQCNIDQIVNSLTEDRSDDRKVRSFEYQECVFVQFPYASHKSFTIQR
jgi:hypothetical protein